MVKYKASDVTKYIEHLLLKSIFINIRTFTYILRKGNKDFAIL